MKINNKMLSIPPFISVAWNHIESLHMKGANLIISLLGGETISIPGLKQETIESIFSAHAQFLEQEAIQIPLAKDKGDFLKDFPFGISQSFPLSMADDSAVHLGMTSFEGMVPVMQHDPSRAMSPDIPAPILQKIGAIVKIVMPEDVIEAPIAMQNCNCPHCQIARAISGEAKIEGAIEEPLVSAEELAFQNWEIKQLEENLYSVVDRLDKTEFKVYLGNPVGCTCGKEGCDHIVAVLKS